MINRPFERRYVKPLRDSLGITQKVLANLIGTTIFAISSWENPANYDKSIRPENSEKLWKLANKHGIKF